MTWTTGDEPPAAAEAARAARTPILAAGTMRAAAALVVTGLLAIGTVQCLALRIGIPLRTGVATLATVLVALALAVILLTRGRAASGRAGWPLRLASLALFGVVLTTPVVNFLGDHLPRWQVAAVLLSASLWAYWLAWGLRWTRRPSRLVAIGGVLVAWGWCFPAVLRFDGLTGDAKAEFAWTQRETAARPPQPAAPRVAEKSGESLPLGPADPLDFPEFLGNRQAHAAPRPLGTDWQASPPQLVWHRAVGAGWSSFAIVGDRAVTMEQRNALECVVCLRLSTGEELWRHAEHARFVSVLGGDGPRATPTIDVDRVYAVGATGLCTCLDLASGQLRWKVDLLADNGGAAIHHGMCGSPLVVDDLVVVSVTGGAPISLVAYDKLQGRRRWQAGKWPASYSSPQMATLLGERQILAYNREGLESHALADGQLLWSYEWTNPETTVCSQPVVVDGRDDQVLLSVGYGRGAVLVELSRTEDGVWQTASRWTSNELKTKFTTAVFHDGFFYGLDNGILTCLDAATGERRWKQGRYQHGQALLVGDYLVIQAESGDVILTRAEPEKHAELGRLPALSRKTWNNPALARDLLVVRNDEEAACYRIAGP